MSLKLHNTSSAVTDKFWWICTRTKVLQRKNNKRFQTREAHGGNGRIIQQAKLVQSLRELRVLWQAPRILMNFILNGTGSNKPASDKWMNNFVVEQIGATLCSKQIWGLKSKSHICSIWSHRQTQHASSLRWLEVCILKYYMSCIVLHLNEICMTMLIKKRDTLQPN